MYDFVQGKPANPVATQILVQALKRVADQEGTVYVGYPIVATAETPSAIDVLLVSSRGVVMFDVVVDPPAAAELEKWQALSDRQTDLLIGLKSKFLAHRDLTLRRELAFTPQLLTFVPDQTEVPEELANELSVASERTLSERLSELRDEQLGAALLRSIHAVLQSIANMKPRKKRASVTHDGSRGAILKKLEREVANLDKWQKKSAIETPEGPQRIRGLAGSGKTIVLALKAAYLHAQHPEWTVGVTFQTRSLYQQIRDHIMRFYFEFAKSEPDWSKLRVLHAWGSQRESGVYADIAGALAMPATDFRTASAAHGRDRAFAEICKELLPKLKTNPKQIFDAVLVDEAQDFPVEFFRLVYEVTKEPKRIIWAYDELQNLGKFSMVPPGELFGHDDAGQPLVTLRNQDDQLSQDIILPKCYRNTPWALSTAHALGFGIYRSETLVQFFDDPTLWQDIGYETVDGEMKASSEVALARRPDCSPAFFAELLTPDDAVVCRSFPDRDQELEWIAKEIHKNLTEDELEADDILVICPDPLTVEKRAGPLIDKLQKRGYRSHIVGVTASRDSVFETDSVAISGIYRAKGNEAPMVYILDGQHCHEGFELIKRRNILFTGITRSRAWVRISGVGRDMDALVEEYKKVRANNFQLRFKWPTPGELEKLRTIHKDMTPDEKRAIKRSEDALADVVRRIEGGEMAIEQFPPELRKRLKALFGAKK